MSAVKKQTILSKIAAEVARVAGQGFHSQAQKEHAVTNYTLLQESPDKHQPKYTVRATRVWLECAYENHLKDDLFSVPIQLEKWVNAFEYASKTGTKFVFAVQFKDGSIYCIKIDQYPVDMFRDDPDGKKCEFESYGSPAREGDLYSGPFNPDTVINYVYIPVAALTPLEEFGVDLGQSTAQR